jgi:ribosomal protein S18 acetylase RimI-like enzyme
MSGVEWLFGMPVTYFKRYRMEIGVDNVRLPPVDLPPGYRPISWRPSLLRAHADTKFRCFRWEIDANVFPCLGDPDGCLRLMGEISRRDGFLRSATWLIEYCQPRRRAEYCGTIQGVAERDGIGCIQNVGVTPEHRGLGLGTTLVLCALEGFRRAGLERARLEVTAENTGAIRLYRRMGFSRVRTVYKAVEIACT